MVLGIAFSIWLLPNGSYCTSTTKLFIPTSESQCGRYRQLLVGIFNFEVASYLKGIKRSVESPVTYYTYFSVNDLFI